MTVITENHVLAEFCARQQGADFVAVDTEFMRERTYWPILCLVQVAGPEEAAAIDALAPGIDLAPLLALMAAERTLKVFHAARQDVEIFFNLTGAVPAPLCAALATPPATRPWSASSPMPHSTNRRDLPIGRTGR
jgi:ribonuclease D